MGRAAARWVQEVPVNSSSPAGPSRGAPPALLSAHPALAFPFTSCNARMWPRRL